MEHGLGCCINHKTTWPLSIVLLRTTNRLFSYFQSPLTSLAKIPLICLVHVSSLSNSAILTYQWVRGHAGIPGNKHADSLPIAGASLPTAMVRPLFFSPAIAKPVTPSITNGEVTFPHFPFHLNCAVPTVYPGELVSSVPICFALTGFASNVKAFYYRRKSVVKNFFPAAPADTFCRT